MPTPVPKEAVCPMPGSPLPEKAGAIVAVHGVAHGRHLPLPLFACGVSAGFPSPAEDYIEGRLDLNELMVRHPAATFFLRVAGESMIGAGIHHNDILVVDRSLTPVSGRVVIAAVNGELTVKRFWQRQGRARLIAENPDYPPIELDEESDAEIWGVVTFVIHSL